MNILKLTENGIVVVTKVGIGVALSDKVANEESYRIRTITEQCDKIESCEICDNDMNPGSKNYPKMVKVTSVAFKEADANCVSSFAKSQENVLTEVLEAEAANLKIVRASELNDRVFEAMLDTSYDPTEDEEN